MSFSLNDEVLVEGSRGQRSLHLNRALILSATAEYWDLGSGPYFELGQVNFFSSRSSAVCAPSHSTAGRGGSMWTWPVFLIRCRMTCCVSCGLPADGYAAADGSWPCWQWVQAAALTTARS